MTKDQQLYSDYAAKLDRKEKELIAQKKAVRAFRKTTHKPEDTEKYLEALEDTESELEDIMASLLDLKSLPEFKTEAEKLCRRCAELDKYTTAMNKTLSDDLAKRQRIEDRREVDVIKNVGFFFAIVASFITGAKHGVGDGLISVNQAAGAGTTVGLLVLFRNKIREKFKTASRAVCETPQQIKDSFTLFYVKETIKEKGLATRNLLYRQKPEP